MVLRGHGKALIGVQFTVTAPEEICVLDNSRAFVLESIFFNILV